MQQPADSTNLDAIAWPGPLDQAALGHLGDDSVT